MTTSPYTKTALDFDPFEGDFGESGDKVFSNKMVIGRGEHLCSHCNGQTQTGERHRCQTSKFDGELMTHRWCAACCEAMLITMHAENNFDDPAIREDQLFCWENRSGMHANTTNEAQFWTHWAPLPKRKD